MVFCSNNSREHKHVYLGLQSLKSHRVQLSSPLGHFALVAVLGCAGFVNKQGLVLAIATQSQGTKQRLNPGRLNPTYQDAATVW